MSLSKSTRLIITLTIIFVNSRRWTSIKSKLNKLSELKLSKKKVILSRKIFFIISNINNNVNVSTKFRNNVSLIKILLKSFFFNIKIKWNVIASKTLTIFRNRILFINQSIDQKQNNLFLKNKKRIQSITMLKIRKYRRKIFSIKNLIKYLT